MLLVIKTVAGERPHHHDQLRQRAKGSNRARPKLKYKDVDVGAVKTITLSKDLSRVLVQVQLTKEGDDFAVKDSRFWVVRPRVAASGV